MREAFSQAVDNLRANKLRSFLTMFGILWGIIAVVVLAATGEGFQRGNQAVLEELGKNIAIVWGGRTTMQAGGERAGPSRLPHGGGCPGPRTGVAARRRRQRRDQPWTAHQEPLQRRLAVGPWHRASISSDPHHRHRARPRASSPPTTSSRGGWPSSARTPGRSCLARARGWTRRSRSTDSRTRSSARSGRRTRTATTAVPTTTRCSCPSPRWRATSPVPTCRRASSRSSSYRPGPSSSATCRECSMRAPAASRTSTGRSSATSATCWRAARISTSTIATRFRCGTPRSRASCSAGWSRP